MPTKLLLVGGGKMGSAMLAGWLRTNLAPGDVIVVEPVAEAAEHLSKTYGVATVPDGADLPADLAPETVVLAVKPQMMEAALPAYARFAGPGTLFLSIAAGTTIQFFERHLGAAAAIVRAMPNTPAAVGRGISACAPNGRVSDAQKAWAETLLSAVGEVVWVPAEGDLDAVTALSGSGPAYVFLLVEAMAAAGEKAGLPADLAMRLARATVCGAGELLYQSDDDAQTLRKNVTSPGGTTAEALKVLMAEPGLQGLIDDAIKQAARRARELAG